MVKPTTMAERMSRDIKTTSQSCKTNLKMAETPEEREAIEIDLYQIKAELIRSLKQQKEEGQRIGRFEWLIDKDTMPVI